MLCHIGRQDHVDDQFSDDLLRSDPTPKKTENQKTKKLELMPHATVSNLFFQFATTVSGIAQRRNFNKLVQQHGDRVGTKQSLQPRGLETNRVYLSKLYKEGKVLVQCRLGKTTVTGGRHAAGTSGARAAPSIPPYHVLVCAFDFHSLASLPAGLRSKNWPGCRRTGRP